LCAPFTVAAETAQQAETEQKLEVITVYAQKRPQPKTEVSVAVSTIDGATIADRRIGSTTALDGIAPNFTASAVSGEGTTPALNIRGIGVFDYNTSTVSPIAVYSDDVVAGGANFLHASLFDLAQIDILRGPQGTLFGRNSTGGALLLRSKLPEADAGGYVSADIAEQQSRSYTAVLNTPLGEETAARLALHQQDYQYSIENLFPLGQNGGMKHQHGRFLLTSSLQGWQLLFKLQQDRSRGAPKPIYSAGILAADGRPCPSTLVGTRQCKDAFGGVGPSDDFWQTVADTMDKSHRTDTDHASVQLSRELADGYELKSITGWKQLDRYHSFDSDGPGNFIEGSLGSAQEVWSQELSLAVTTEDRYWQSGLFYLADELTQQNDLDLFRDFRVVPGLTDIPAQFFYHNQIDNYSWSLFSQLDQQLHSNWTLTLGLRYTDEKTRYQAQGDLDTVAMVIPALWQLQGEVKDQHWSGKVALLQQLRADLSWYYSLTRGFKAGGYNGGYSTSPAQAAASEYAAETLNAWEIGGHWQPQQLALGLDWAVFYYDYQDQQVFVNQSSSTAPFHVLKNAGDSQIYGLETEFWWRPVPAAQWRFAAGYLPKANMGSYQTDAALLPENRLPFSSKWQLSSEFSYDLSAWLSDVQVSLGAVWRSAFYFDQYQNPYTAQPGYALWHSRVSYQPSADLEISLWGKNLLNKKYTELKFDSTAALAAITELRGERRQLGVGLSYHF
jgi:iron complex outermembrane receptor protein